RARAVRSREHDLAGLEARLKSLEELDAARAGYDDAARTVLVQANGTVSQRGAIADYLEVDAGYERAVEACLGDLLQHVVVERPEHAAAGFQLVREASAGRCGFLVTSAVVAPGPAKAGHYVPSEAEAGHYLPSEDVSRANAYVVSGFLVPPKPLGEGGSQTIGRDGDGTVPSDIHALSSVVRINGPFAAAIRAAIGDAWIAPSYARAAEASALTPWPVATMEGDLFRGPHLVSGGDRAEARGILETKREIKVLRDRMASERDALARLTQDTAEIETVIAHASSAIAALNAEHHRQEKAVVGHDAQLQHASDEQTRLAQKTEQLARERHQAEEERHTLDRRQEEARASIIRLDASQREADERL